MSGSRKWWHWVAGLGLVLMGAAAWGTTIRMDAFREMSPTLSTRTKGILRAHSVDGLHFEVDPRPIAWAPATSQTHGQTRTGQLQVIGTDTTDLIGRDASGQISAPKISTLFSLNPDTNERTPLLLAPCINRPDSTAEPVQCVDPNLLVLADGRQLLTFVRKPGRGDPAFAKRGNLFLSALSVDGEEWTTEPGVRFIATHAADPDMVRLPDGRWRLYYTAGSVENPWGGGRAPGIRSVISVDGRNFRPEPGVRAYPCSASTTVALKGGGYRMYCHTREIFNGLGPDNDPAAYVISLRSVNGLEFELEAGVRIDADPVPGARFIGSEAPSISVESDGSITMLLTTVIEERFPWNWLLFRREKAHQQSVQARAHRRGTPRHKKVRKKPLMEPG
jgi:hypothetical protein